MKPNYLKWIVLAAFVIFLLSKCVYDGINAVNVDSIKDSMEQESRLVEGKCTKSEMINRWLLQQSWFYDEQYTDLAGAFGQVSFGMFNKGNPKKEYIQGAFCIAGNNLIVRYYETSAVPNSFEFRSLSDWTIKFGSKIKPLGEDIYKVQELTEKRMTLRFQSDGNEHVFYRKD
jgi:hypothetical protein